MWSTEGVRGLSTEQIIRKLRGFGIEFTKEEFLREAANFYSACDLADHWREIYLVTAEGFYDDFVWMAAVVLWERWAPNLVNSEQIDDAMQNGYDLLEEGKVTEACTVWLKAWGHLKKRFFSRSMRSIHDADRVFSGYQSLYNWCQDVEGELQNAGAKDPAFHEKRIKYCREFCSLFPETDDLIIQNMKRAEAESYMARGMLEKGETTFKALIKEFPNSVWGYIGWGDVYCSNRWSNVVPPDYEKARRAYQMALARNVENKEYILSRLKELKRKTRGQKNSTAKVKARSIKRDREPAETPRQTPR